jgi:hypothetical protein
MFATQFLNQGSREGAGTGPVPTTIQIGTPGTLASNSLGIAPFSPAYNYSWATWIIEASELSGANGDITAISLWFDQMSDSPTYVTNKQRIWVSHIGSISTWSNNLPHVDFSGGPISPTNRTQCKVFDKTWTDAEEGTWVKFDFDTNNFAWNGVDNIAIEWLNKDETYNYGGPRFDINNKSGSVAYRRLDANYPSGQGLLDAERPITKLHFNGD